MFLVGIQGKQGLRSPVFCVPESTLDHVLYLFANNGCRRIYVVDSGVERRPIGVITLADIVQFVMDA